MTSVADAGMVVTAVVVVVAAAAAAPFDSVAEEAGAVFSKEVPEGTSEEKEAAPGGFGTACIWAVNIYWFCMIPLIWFNMAIFDQSLTVSYQS